MRVRVCVASTGKYQFARPLAAQRAATILGCTGEELAAAIFHPTGQRGNTLRMPGIDKTTPSSDVVTGVDALEGFVSGLYAEACGALVALINRYACSILIKLFHIILLALHCKFCIVIWFYSRVYVYYRTIYVLYLGSVLHM